ncbi:translocation/assembly module TamB domain-containing protein [Saccharothrix hoggarensis]|uniref:Membrane-associated oxidoreductase n=1 Tax=Saccharothrix hoggarensis TaxID=913853 RepID=A0ABW3QY67_9PSEU
MAEVGARGLDVFDPSPPRSARMAAAEVLRGVAEPDGPWRLPRRRAGMPPVVRVADRFLTGTLDLRAVEFPYVLEFVRCRFEEPPDLRQGKLAGIEFADCWLPGLAARNLSSANDVSLVGSTVEGLVDLVDAEVAGSLTLRDAELRAPGTIALHADRLKLAGGVLAQRVRVTGELRMAGAHVGGYCNVSGGLLDNPLKHAFNGTGLHVGGNLLMSGCTLNGTVLLAGARVDSALTLRGSTAAGGRADDDALDPHSDPNATLVFDRITVDGDVQLDRGFTSAGTVRMVNAAVGGTLSLSGGAFDALGESTPEPTGYGRALDTGAAEPTGYGRALHLDGTQVGGDLIGRQARVRGQLRMVDFQAKGSLILDGSTLDNPRADAVLGNRSRIGSNLAAREVEVTGGLELRGVRIGANLDLRGSRITQPGRYRHQPAGKPSLDVGGAAIGRDLICARGAKEFVAHGGVRARRATVGRMATFAGAVLGDKLDAHALNLLGMQVQELVVTPIGPPRGDVTLRQVRCTSLDDNENFWSATGRIDLEEFRYDSLRNPIDLRDDAEVERRLRWLRQAMRRTYRPGPYDQFAEMLRAAGNDEHAATVLVEKQRLRYRAVAEGRRWLGPLVLVWSWLQRAMVGYGYRPARALAWLVVMWLAGSAYFASGPELSEINEQDKLTWNPWLFTIDLLVPIVDLGNKNRWHTPDESQWIAAGLIAMGWVLATTVAAGVTRALKR